MNKDAKAALLAELKDEFDDYIDYYDLMECLPGVEEGKVASLKAQRQKNGLSSFSYYCNAGGTLMVSVSEFKAWVKRSFRNLPAPPGE